VVAAGCGGSSRRLLAARPQTLATVRAARAEGLRVAACVLSEVASPRGRAGGPESDEQIAADAEADLRRLLPDVPVTRLGHNASDVRPPIDWWAAAGQT